MYDKTSTKVIPVKFPNDHWILKLPNRNEYIQRAVEEKKELEEIKKELAEIKEMLLSLPEVKKPETGHQPNKTMVDRIANSLSDFE